MVIPTPPDALCLRASYILDTKAFAQENRELKDESLLFDLIWRSYLKVLGVIQTQAQPEIF